MENENENVPNRWPDDAWDEDFEIIRLVKLQKMWTTDAFDELIFSKIVAAKADMLIVGIPSRGDLYREAIITYCVMNLGVINPNEYDRLKRAYDEMKAQLQMSVSGEYPYADCEDIYGTSC